MNKEEAFSRFIKNNLISLTSPSLEKSKQKIIIRNYFLTEHNKKFGMPKPTQICEALIKYQIKNGVDKSTVEAQFDVLPIYKNVGEKKLSEFVSLISVDTDKTALSVEELSRIGSSEAYVAIKEIEHDRIKHEFEEEHRELLEVRSQLNKQIEDKQNEFLAIPSILDETVIPEPEFSPEIEDVKPWWQRFYLKANPFPGNKDGLSKIEASLYEKVVVKTKPYQTLISNLDNNVDSIFDTAYMLVGDFGFGKTTLQDYFSYYLVNKNILPIRITCLKAQPDCNGYYDYFNQRLIKELSRELKGKNTNFDYSDPDLVIDMCQEICEQRAGIIIFLDDYHKHRSGYFEIYDFLGTLQILKNQLTRNEVNVGFIVSAVPEWEESLSSHQQMSGFFDSSPIVMPTPDPSLIRSVFNQRISAYCYDTSPREIQIEFVENIFDISDSKGNYRDYLNRIIEELENNNMAIVSSPIEISEAVLDDLKSTIVSDPTVWSPMQKLLKGSRFKNYNEEQISKCLELLVVLHTQKGVNENEPVFKENKYYFSRLKETGLINKKKDSSSSNNFSWVSSPSIYKCANKIKLKFGYNFQDYFLKLFSHKKSNLLPSSSKNSFEYGIISKFKSFIDENKLSISDSIFNSIEESLVLYDKFDVDLKSKPKKDKAVDDMMMSLENLSNSLFELDGSLPFFIGNDLLSLEDRWRQHHIDGEVVDQFLLKSASYTNNRDTIQYSLTLRQAKDAFNFICDRIKLIVLDMKSNADGRFGYGAIQSKQNPADINFYDSIRSDLYSPSKEVKYRFFEQTKNHVESSMRDFLYISSVMAFGNENYFKKPNDKVTTHQHNSRTTTYSEAYNKYAGISREQIKSVFLDGSLVKSIIIDNLDLDWTNDIWNDFFDVFIEKTDGKILKDLSDCSKFCKQSVDLIGAMNTIASKIPVNCCYMILDGGKNKVDDVIFKSGFSVLNTVSYQNCILDSDINIFQKDSQHERHLLEPVIYDRVKKQVLKNVTNDRFYENMMEISYIKDHYKVEYYEFVLSLVYMAKVEELIEIKNWFGSHIVISKKEFGIKPSVGDFDIDTHEFDVALSFPGESRPYVQELVKELHLSLGKGKYFYDHTYQAHLARFGLGTLLEDIYGKRSKLVVVFLSEDYENKPWCGLEFRVIKELIFDKQPKKVMLVRLGSGKISGVVKTDGFIDADVTGPKTLSNYILERLSSLK